MLGGSDNMYEDNVITNQGTFKDFFWGLVFGIGINSLTHSLAYLLTHLLT